MKKLGPYVIGFVAGAACILAWRGCGDAPEVEREADRDDARSTLEADVRTRAPDARGFARSREPAADRVHVDALSGPPSLRPRPDGGIDDGGAEDAGATDAGEPAPIVGLPPVTVPDGGPFSRITYEPFVATADQPTPDSVRVRGVVRWVGEVPPPIHPTNTSDCGAELPQQTLELDGARHVANAVVDLDFWDWRGTSRPPQLTFKGPAAHVTSRHCVFEPHIQLADTHDLDVTNDDTLIRDVEITDGLLRQLPGKGETLHLPSALNAGTNELHDRGMPWMHAYVVNDPGALLTPADGSFDRTFPAGYGSVMV